MKIVISDDYQNSIRSLECFSRLRAHEVTIYHDTVKKIDELVERFKDAEAIVLIRERTIINAELLARLPKLKVIAQTGKIAAHVDLAACKKHSVTVMDGRGAGQATVELTLLLILASLRNLVAENQRTLNGQWQGGVGRQLSGKVLGIYGFGRLGAQVCAIGQAFGAKILVWGRESSLQKAITQGYAVAHSKEEFFRQSDVLSLHLRLTPDTRGIVNRADLARMKPNAVLVNASRAELIETGALVECLQQGRPGFAAVDVYEDEPIFNTQHPLFALKNCLCTPHIGFVEQDNYEAYFGTAFDNLNAYAAGTPQNVVKAKFHAEVPFCPRTLIFGVL